MRPRETQTLWSYDTRINNYCVDVEAERERTLVWCAEAMQDAAERIERALQPRKRWWRR